MLTQQGPSAAEAPAWLQLKHTADKTATENLLPFIMNLKYKEMLCPVRFPCVFCLFGSFNLIEKHEAPGLILSVTTK